MRSEPPSPAALGWLALGWLAPALLALGCRAEREPEARRPNLVLVVVDTLRADRLGCYGHEAAATPRIDALARDGVLFEGLHGHVPQTLPAVASILTGTYPPTHGVRTNGIFALPGSALTLAETLSDAGYRTAGFVAAAALDARFGIDQGFETYGGMRAPGVPGVDAPEISAERITDDALRWLASDDERPFFLMVHYSDPQHAYLPPAGYRDFEHPYDGAAAFVDAQLGRLLDRLDQLGRRADTLVALTSDHGECLGEHGRVGHRALLFEAVLRVPLLLRLPGALPSGRRVTGVAGSVDVMPTLLELCGVRVPGSVAGRSLLPAIEAGDTAREELYFESLYGMLEIDAAIARTGIVRGPWKLVRNFGRDPDTGLEAEAFELFNLAQDPDEERNLAGRREAVVEKLRAALEAFERLHPAGSADVITPDGAVLARLKALGYF